jgi:hypothetical protein
MVPRLPRRGPGRPGRPDAARRSVAPVLRARELTDEQLQDELAANIRIGVAVWNEIVRRRDLKTG